MRLGRACHLSLSVVSRSSPYPMDVLARARRGTAATSSSRRTHLIRTLFIDHEPIRTRGFLFLWCLVQAQEETVPDRRCRLRSLDQFIHDYLNLSMWSFGPRGTVQVQPPGLPPLSIQDRIPSGPLVHTGEYHSHAPTAMPPPPSFENIRPLFGMLAIVLTWLAWYIHHHHHEGLK